jgi:SSS family solute:Na+ symporter
VTPLLFVVAYLAAVLYIGIFAFRRQRPAARAEDFFLAGRSIGGFVFLFSLFGTHMTAFAILGSSGHAFQNGIVTYGLMASSSAIVVPLLLLTMGTRLWAIGKRFGFLTPVQIFRDRWECGHTGTVIFALQAALLLPYIIVGMKGGGTTLEALSGGAVPYWAGSALVAVVVMCYVTFGGMRGTAWVNTFQTLLFLSFGAIAVIIIGRGMGGFGQAAESLLSSPPTAALMSRERVAPLYFFSYTFLPLSAIAFPHISIFCLTARRMAQFRKTVIAYPLCLLAIWLPCVYLGVVANQATEIPGVRAKVEARAALAQAGPSLAPEERARLRSAMAGDDILIVLLEHYAPVWLVGVLGAGIMAAVMASDSQILALSTMFTEDVFAYYGHKERFGEQAQVMTGRIFVLLLAAVAYFIALRAPIGIFELASQYAFAGFSAMVPLLAAALFWKRSTKWGALAAVLWIGACVGGIALLQAGIPPPAGPPVVLWSVAGVNVLERTAAGANVFGMLPAVAMTVGAAFWMWLVSVLTQPPSQGTIDRYFPRAVMSQAR